jgi:N-acetylglucosamine malate deacetylase 1
MFSLISVTAEKPKVALVLCPHPDDEIGCSGLIIRLVSAGWTVHHYWFADCAISTQARGFEPQQLLQECDDSRKLLGLKLENCGQFNFPVRNFPAYRQQILESLLGLRQKLKPDLVLTVSRNDSHQDHQTLTQEAIRCFKHSSILGYQLVWNTFQDDNDLFVHLAEADIEQKLAALAAYKTQANMSYVDPDFTRGLARVRGVQANSLYAESYEVIRLHI